MLLLPMVQKLLMLTKKDEWCNMSVQLARERGFSVTHYAGDRENPLPVELDSLDLRDYNLISFLSPWIIPERILDAVKVAINIHPAPPKYPGIGCYNFALFDGEKEYGVMAHIMLPKVDSGRIIKVRYFPIFPTDTIFSLKERCLDQGILLFGEILEMIQKDAISFSGESWLRKPYTRKDLIRLCDVTELVSRTMSSEETEKFQRILKAAYFPNAKDRPFIRIGENRFVLEQKNG